MSMTPEQAEETARDFITWVTERAVMQALEGYGHRTLRLKIYVRAMPESDKFEVEVHYGSRRQYKVAGTATLTGLEGDFWSAFELRIMDFEQWLITASRSHPDGIPTWELNELL